MEFENPLPALKEGFEFLRSAIGVLKDAKELLPGDKKAAVESSVSNAERSFQIAEAQMAQALGFHLCKCDWPPKIMTSKGYHPQRDEEVFECPACKMQKPSQQHFDDLDRREARRREAHRVIRSGSWAG